MSKTLRKNFDSLDEAMAALPQKTYEHCKRVSAYMEIIFLRACAAEIYPNDQKVQSRLKDENREIARLAGLYHDIGKAMLPEEYHTFDPSFSQEEQALYRTHVDNSIQLLDKMFRKETKCTANQEKYLLQGIGFHHEHWDGQGFPNNMNGRNTTIFPRMVALADEMDHLFCETHSETPFEDAMEVLKTQGGKAFDPELIKLLPSMRRRLKKVFNANLGATRIIPDINAFVKKDPKSPIEYWYRPIEEWGGDGTYACEMDIRFKGNKNSFMYDEVAQLIKNEPNMRRDVGIYTSLAACDMIRRLGAANLPMNFVAVNFPTGWLNTKGAAKEILLAISDSAVDSKRFCVVLRRSDFSERRAVLKENIEKLTAAGCEVMFDRLTIKEVADAVRAEVLNENGESGTKQVKKEKAAEGTGDEAVTVKKAKAPKNEIGVVTAQEIIDLGATMYRMGAGDAEFLESDAFVKAMKELGKKNIRLMADDLDREKNTSILLYLQVALLSGPVRGNPMPEEDFFRNELSNADYIASKTAE